MMKRRYFASAVVLTFLMGLEWSSLCAEPAENENHAVVDGVAIYLGIMPAEIILGHQAEHSGRKMPHAAPTGADEDHFVIALFDSNTGKRITNAQVRATIGEVGLPGQTKDLQPMKIADTITYGNYFELPGGNEYRIRLQIRIPGRPNAIEAEFLQRHFGNDD